MMRCSFYVLVLLAFAKADYLTAQSTGIKQEKEQQISVQEFPATALQIVETMTAVKRAKLFKEFDGENTSYEAKFRKSGRNFSMEFSPDGSLQDLEVESNRKDLNRPLWKKIKAILTQTEKRWRVEKIQLQYLPDPTEIETLKQKVTDKNYDRIEMIVAFKTNKKIYRKEILFNAQGIKIKEREVNRNAYDFLLF